MEALKVAIADDNENMLKVLGQVIGQEQDLSVVGYGDEWRRYISHH